MTVNFDDPAAVLAVLRPAYLALIAGEKTQEVQIPAGNGQFRKVTYHAASIPELRSEIGRQEAKLSVAGKRPRRFAIRAG
jgi:hypothetical protein